MDEFLTWLKRRKSELENELRDLEAAERIYKESGIRLMLDQRDLNLEPTRPKPRPKNIKEMVLKVLEEDSSSGLTALQILDQITRQWMPDLERTSLSPQLSRLKNEGKIINLKGVWQLHRSSQHALYK